MMKKIKIYGIIFVTIIFGFTFFSFAQSQSDPQETENVQYTADTLRDPFESWLPKEASGKEIQVLKTEIKLPDFKIQGVVLHHTKPTAIINNQVVKVGDTINEVKIIDIKKEGIDIIYQGQIFNIPSPSSEIKNQN